MATPFDFQSRIREPWLVGTDPADFAEQVQHYRALLAAPAIPPRILLAEPDPVRFLAGFLAACIAQATLILANPHWSRVEYQQAISLTRPTQLWSSLPLQLSTLAASTCPGAAPPLILIPTGGTSGTLRFAMHTWETLMAAVEGFRTYFQLGSVNSVCVLPLYHVSGLMQFLRSFSSGGQFAIATSKALEQPSRESALGSVGLASDLDVTQFVTSLVPTQLQRLLKHRADWLAQFQMVLLGGAPAWPTLLAQARHHQIRVAPTYGMTETAAQVATLKPEAFLAGQTGCGQVLPHAQVMIDDGAGQPLAANQVGQIQIHAASLALGYYPDCFTSRTYRPDDLGYLDPHGYLHLVGRASDKIITGGENVFPAEVEAALRATGLVDDVCVVGLPDAEWGEAITAVYVARPQIALNQIQAAIAAYLSRFKYPKHWVAVGQLPRNPQGKVVRSQVLQLAQLAITSETHSTLQLQSGANR